MRRAWVRWVQIRWEGGGKINTSCFAVMKFSRPYQLWLLRCYQNQSSNWFWEKLFMPAITYREWFRCLGLTAFTWSSSSGALKRGALSLSRPRDGRSVSCPDPRVNPLTWLLICLACPAPQGSTELKLLALDIPSADGNSVRIFLAGKPSQLEQGPGLFDELCKPLRTVRGPCMPCSSLTPSTVPGSFHP